MEGFEFVDGERTFACSVEKAPAAGNEAWWWFTVSTDDRQRYAPFRASARDTQKSVRERIVAYYDELLERRAAPTVPYWRRGAQSNEQGKAAAPTAAAAPPPPAPAKSAAKPAAVPKARPAKAKGR
jgi:hypothetical protein